MQHQGMVTALWQLPSDPALAQQPLQVDATLTSNTQQLFGLWQIRLKHEGPCAVGEVADLYETPKPR